MAQMKIVGACPHCGTPIYGFAELDDGNWWNYKPKRPCGCKPPPTPVVQGDSTAIGFLAGIVLAGIVATIIVQMMLKSM